MFGVGVLEIERVVHGVVVSGVCVVGVLVVYIGDSAPLLSAMLVVGGCWLLLSFCGTRCW